MRRLGGIFALLAFLATSGCAVIEQERFNRGGYLDYVLDQNWMKADSKGMRALRAFAIQVSLARIASISAKNDSDRQLLAIRIGALTKRFIPIYLCAFDTNPLGVPGAERDPCFYYDSAMVEYANGLFDLAMVALPKDDAKKLFDTVSGAFVSPVNLVELLNALLLIARDAIVYGRTVGALYRDSVELEVQLWISTPEIDDRPPPARVTPADVADLQAIYSQRNDNMQAWLAAMAALRERGLEPLPQRKFFGELGGLMRYICDQITQDKNAADQCKFALPKTMRPPMPVLGAGTSFRVGDEIGRVTPSGPAPSRPGTVEQQPQTGPGPNVQTPSVPNPTLQKIDASITKARARLPMLVAFLSKTGDSFTNKTFADVGNQIALQLQDIDDQIKQAAALNRVDALRADYQALVTKLEASIKTIQALADTLSQPTVNKADVAARIAQQVQGDTGLQGADALVGQALVIIRRSAAGA